MFEGLFQPTHLIIIFAIALLVFGPKKLPELGKGLGEGIRNFKKGLREDEEDPRARHTEGDEDVEVQVVKVPKKQLPAAEAPKKKRVIQIEVDEDADEEEIARRVAAKKKAMASEDEKST